MENNNPQQLNIEITDEMAEGTYANLAVISHSTSEFVVDFIRVMPNAPKAKVQSRIILTPEHAKRLLGALNDNIRRYEAAFGNIKLPEQGGPGTPPFPMGGFNAPPGQA